MPNDRSLRTPVWILLLLGALVPIGCGDGDDSDDALGYGEVALLAEDYAMALKGSVDLYTLTMLGFIADEQGSRPGPERHPAPGDTLLPGVLTCPVVTADVGVGSRIELTFDFGTGCETSADGGAASGSIVVLVAERPTGGFDLDVEFDDFIRDARRVNGALLATGRLDTVSVQLGGLSFTGPEGSAIASGTLEFSRETELPAPGAGLCVRWSLENGEVALASDRATFGLEVLTPVIVTSCCPYPTQGTVLVTAPGFLPARIDFGDGACDDEIEITIAGVSRTSSLGAADGA